jgi:hypothetical protein
VVLSVTLAGACYSYVPLATTPPTSGAELRVELNREGTATLTSRFGPNVTAVDGTLSSVSGDGSLSIGMSALQMANGARQELIAADTITLPRVLVAGVEVRTLNRRKTTVAAVAIGAVVVTAGVVAMRGARGDAAATEPAPGPLTARAPAWMRIR